MAGTHLTPSDLENYALGAIDASRPTRAEYAQHLASCAACRARALRAEKFESGLRAMPRQAAPRDLADRIIAAVDWRVTQDEARRRRLPYIAFATAASFIISFWFVLQMVSDLYETDAVDFLSLFTSRPDLLLAYYSDGLSALWESLPLPAIALTLFAIAVALVLAQQLMENFRPGMNKLRRI
jgi:hypothetical protein